MEESDFEDLTEQEKLQKLRELHRKIEEGDQGKEDIDFNGTFTVNVYDEDGNLKTSESQNFKY